MKNIIILSFLLLIMGCQRSPVDDRSFKTIMIKSVGEVEALPDQATFTISLYCLDKTVQASKQCLVTKSNDLISKLQSLGVGKNDIITTSVSMDRSYTWRNNSSVFEGYRSATSIIVTVKKIESLDEIYTELLENRNLELGGLNFNHSQIDSLNNEAYVKALKRSEKLADKLLEQLPENDKEVLKIGNVEITTSLPESQRHMGDAVMAETASVSNQSIRVNAGTMKIEATLYVEYQID